MAVTPLTSLVELLRQLESFQALSQGPCVDRVEPCEEFRNLLLFGNVENVEQCFAVLQPVAAVLDSDAAAIVFVLRYLDPEDAECGFTVISNFALVNEYQVRQQTKRTSLMVEARALKCFHRIDHIEVICTHGK